MPAPRTATVDGRRAPDAWRVGAYHELVARVQACRACPRMDGRRRILGDANGPVRARAILVGTAPGRHGAERTGIPFSGDRSGEALDVLLARAGLTRADVFVTNAVLCNPQDVQGRNAEPTAAELRRCRQHLRDTLAMVDAPLVVALGRTAFAALCALTPPDAAPHNVRGTIPPWQQALGMATPWQGRLLAAAYHPGPRVWMQPLRRAALVAQWDAIFQLGGELTVKVQVRS
ncbi:MAG TPA: uracil-DNA glycosylase [Candidatus Dormibacteraeota bacterium]|jgi:uracil-DNA glycosylase family 4|nr:uracil-DNA glycosylase [Candidatus Dormibacteraeota bacterium]